ncbi:MAG: type IV secretion system DNA-binding domain-containing protein [Solirubrobacterales bacterium]|nr:type IV secretion system DNA-binding domain-containing protein [Solirubrobacterales bacterium]
MEAPLLALGAGALALGSGVLVLARPRPEPETVRCEIKFATDVTEAKVKAVIAGISGMSRTSQVLLDTEASSEAIRHFIECDRSSLAMLRGHLRGVMPQSRLEELDKDRSDAGWTLATRWRFPGGHPVFRTDATAESISLLLGGVTDLGSGERVMVRWRVSPASTPNLPEASGAKASKSRVLFGARTVSTEHLKLLRSKYAGPLVAAELIVVVKAASTGRARQLTSRITTVLRSRVTRGSLRTRSTDRTERQMKTAARSPQARFSPVELAGLLGWPIDSPALPGLNLGTAPQLTPSPAVPTGGKGRTFGTSTWPGMEKRKLTQPVIGAMSHALLLGPTGTGKSTLMTELAAADARGGRGFVLIDMKGDTAESILERIPEHRVDDVIVLDPAEDLAVPGLKVLGDGDPELAADMLLATFKGIFSDSWGVRSDQYLRQGFVTLAHDKEATVADLGFLFTNVAYRQKLISRIDDPMLKAAWAAYDSMRPGEQAQHLASPLRKVNEVIGRKIVRAVLAQTEPRFDMREVLRKGQIVVVSLSPGRLGAPAAQLIGALVTYEVYKAVLARQEIPERARQPFGFYIDEPKVLSQGSPLPLDSMFELFRGMACGITLGAQSITQLDRDLQRAALSNAATLVAFRQGRQDAELLANEISGVTAESMQHLPKFEAVAGIGLGPGDVAPPATIRTSAPSEPTSNPVEVRRRSAELYGSDPEGIDRALRIRHGIDAHNGTAATDSPLGRRRRAS